MLSHELQIKFITLNKQLNYIENWQVTALQFSSNGFFARLESGSSTQKIASAENPHKPYTNTLPKTTRKS